jgi:hypothetical protein
LSSSIIRFQFYSDCQKNATLSIEFSIVLIIFIFNE